tara:strand:- start:3583 stop:3750 length:168 start_codon:yes stop_codon:yes gene_type:complete
MARKKTPPPPQQMGEGAVRDIVQEIVRTAIRGQARELEKYLQDIDDRLRTLEEKG